MLKSNCHTHTVFCDGSNTLEEMVDAAIKLDFLSLGFSVHSPMNFENGYALKKEDVNKYISKLNELKNQYKNIELYNGIELDSDYDFVNPDDFDYVIASVHQLHCNNKIYSIDYSADKFAECIKTEYGGSFLAMAKDYYSTLSNFVCKIKPDVVGHFDLIEKFNENHELYDTDRMDYKLLTTLYLEKICLNCPDIIFEINTGAMFRCKNKRPYPAPFVMQFLKERKIKITITSDAHCTQALNYGFDEALEYVKSFGFNEVYVLKGGKFVATEI